jgi:glyoxylase-like metal-dependent hydrolase (beta-lactamase superfamily II)
MRAALAILLALLLSACATTTPTGSAAEAVPTLTPIQVGPHSWYVEGLPGVASQANHGYNSNAGFVITTAGVVVIDTLGTPALGRALIAAIRRITPQPIVRVVLTHFHADHFYGLAPFKAAGAEIYAQIAGRGYTDSAVALARHAQRARDLAPWVRSDDRLQTANYWIDDAASFMLGGVRFQLTHLGPAHSPEDLIVQVVDDQLLYSGDILFAGRVPYVGEADSREWLATTARLLAFEPRVMVAGHGPASFDPLKDLVLTRDYIADLRSRMQHAVDSFSDFDAAYAAEDWSRWSALPAFEAANRANAYNIYLQIEQEALQAEHPDAP